MIRAPNETLYEFLLRLRRDGVGATQYAAGVRGEIQTSDEVTAALRTALSHPEEGLVAAVVGLAAHHLDPAIAPSLRAIVESSDLRLGLEDAVELLGELRDVEAVPALARIVRSRPHWDDGGMVGAKAVDALAAIGTDDARAVVRDAVQSPIRRVWQAATWPIVKRGFDRDGEYLLVIGRRLIAEDPESHQVDAVLRALARMNTPEAWAIIESAAVAESDECRAVAEELLRESHDQ